MGWQAPVFRNSVAQMDWNGSLTQFTPYDFAALALLVAAWLGIGWRIEHPGSRRPSVSVIMAQYRREWMRQMVTRQPRIFDASILSNLRQGTAFFASASMIALGGGLALLGDTDRIAAVAEDLDLGSDPQIVWEIKLICILLFVANAFLKFVWSHRLFGYCSVLAAAVPNEIDDPEALPRAAQAAEVNITAARGFNRGLRSVYFALAAGAWLLGPWALMLATVVTVTTLWRREFASHSRAALLSRPVPKHSKVTPVTPDPT